MRPLVHENVRTRCVAELGARAGWLDLVVMGRDQTLPRGLLLAHCRHGPKIAEWLFVDL